MPKRTTYACPDCGGTITKVGPVVPDTIPCVPTCGGTMVQSSRPVRLRACATWPMYSDAAGVAPSQVREAEEHARKIGIPTSFLKDGRAIFEGPAHRKTYCEAVGLFDRNGGYSDPQPNRVTAPKKRRTPIWERYPRMCKVIRG